MEEVTKIPKQAEKKSRKTKGETKTNKKPVEADRQIPGGSLEEHDDSGVPVSTFNYSVDDHFRALDTISRLCGEAEADAFRDGDIKRLSSTITFLREWRHFTYEPRNVSFSTETPEGKDVVNGIKLPEFSSAAVPKKERLSGDKNVWNPDFVMYVGGPVWALDWCPRVHQKPDSHIKCEFIAVAAHPPDCSHNKLGEPLIGLGIIQIWCLLNVNVREEEVLPPKKRKPKLSVHKSNIEVPNDEPTQLKRPRGRPRKEPVESTQPKKQRDRPTKKHNELLEDDLTQPKRLRRKPRKKPANEESLDGSDFNSQFVQPIDVQFPENSSEPFSIIGISKRTPEGVPSSCIIRQKRLSLGMSKPKSNSRGKTSAQKKVQDKTGRDGNRDSISIPLLIPNEGKESLISNSETCNNVSEISQLDSVPKHVALPRVVLCLAHNGKVAWDAKWQPANGCVFDYKHQLGYLAVLLGNGSLEVWDVPSPQAVKDIYSSDHMEGTDPRFLKLEPVFRCSKLKSGDRRSIPLTVEWSASIPHDLILAGCHDGTVALWKFCASVSSEDTRPLLIFCADSVSIRAVAWAPVESDQEGANVIVTAGHGGLKFWDIRDPFRPLWDINPIQRIIYSLDWLPDPRCIFLSFDDGTLGLLSLAKAGQDTPVTGRPFVGTQQQGFHNYCRSSFCAWSVHVSRVTGMVAYCSADGTIRRFQLKPKSVDKDPLRNRAPQYLCGSLTEEGSSVSVNTPVPDNPFLMKKSSNESGDIPRSMRHFLSDSNQVKRVAKGQTSDDRTFPALCWGADQGMENEGEDTLACLTDKPTRKSKSSRKKWTKDEEALACSGGQADNLQNKESTREANKNAIEVFPPKIVAMHRVRWNMNKGSERWLCYGGAAGIVRCQVIYASEADKKTYVMR